MNTIVVCDIQPEYENFFSFDLNDFISYINEALYDNKSVIFLYNGTEFGMISEPQYIDWLVDNGIDVDYIDNIIFFEKNYGFFRDIMEYDFTDEEIIYLLEYLQKSNTHTSQDLTDEQINELAKHNSKYAIIDEAPIYIPDLYDFMQSYNNFKLVGGYEEECLKECIILFKFMKLNYNLNTDFVY